MKPWEIRKMRHAGKTLDTLLPDETPPHYFIGAGYRGSVDTSPSPLSTTSRAHLEHRKCFYRGGHFLLHRRRYLALDGGVHHLFDDCSTNRSLKIFFLTMANGRPFIASKAHLEPGT